MAEGAKEGMTLPLRFAYTESHKNGQGAGKMCLKKSQLFNSDTFVELWRGKKYSSLLYSVLIYCFLSLFPVFYLLGQERRLWRCIYYPLFTCLVVLAGAGIQCAVFHCHCAQLSLFVSSSCRNFVVLGFVASPFPLLWLCSLQLSQVCTSWAFASVQIFWIRKFSVMCSCNLLTK